MSGGSDIETVRRSLRESAELKNRVAESLADKIAAAAAMISGSLGRGGKLLLCGNGGSAGDAQHIAAELVGRYKAERRGLPAIALTVDSSALTAIGNDYGFDRVFERQVEALARPGDALIGITTSGNSENVLRAIRRANELGVATIALLGRDGGKAKDLAQLAVIVPSNDTARIQEAHIAIGHIICELIERNLPA